LLRLLVCAVAVAVAAIGAGSVADGAINHPAPGVFGTVTATGGCSLLRRGQHCPPRPVTTTVKAVQHGETVKSTTSNSDGQYAMALPDGTYRIVVANGSNILSCPAKTVRIRSTQSVQVNITCHLNIR